MTPEEWDRCADPWQMLEFLRARASERQLRLFACACWRRWGEDLVRLGRGTRLLDAARELERLADGLDPLRPLDEWATTMLAHTPSAAALQATHDLLRQGDELGGAGAIAGLIRDVFGNPLKTPHILDPGIMAWNGGAARRLAAAIYESRRFGDLAVLADILEEAGCCDVALLNHLRGSEPHVLGCWALDAVLRKN
jgi:hypothetical protein